MWTQTKTLVVFAALSALVTEAVWLLTPAYWTWFAAGTVGLSPVVYFLSGWLAVRTPPAGASGDEAGDRSADRRAWHLAAAARARRRVARQRLRYRGRLPVSRPSPTPRAWSAA